MIDVRVYLTESNAIEGVHDDGALTDSLDAWEVLQGHNELTHTTLRSTHEQILQNRQPEIAGTYRSSQVEGGDRRPPPSGLGERTVEGLLSGAPADTVGALERHVAFEQVYPFEASVPESGRGSARATGYHSRAVPAWATPLVLHTGKAYGEVIGSRLEVIAQFCRYFESGTSCPVSSYSEQSND